MIDEHELDEATFEPSHNKLSTPIGRRIEKIAYWQVGTCAAISIIITAIYFWIAAGGHNGLDKSGGESFGEALYFSIVTFSTVGYGDFAPLGWGRIVATAEMIAGLILTSLFVGKIASERQSALLLLIYTSDQQRRIFKFADEIRGFRNCLAVEIPTIDNVKANRTLVRSLRAYLIFQSHQGRLADFGNGSALRNLYKAMLELQKEIANKLKSVSMSETEVEAGLVQISERLARLAEIMRQFHKNERGPTADLNAIRTTGNDIKQWERTSITVRRQEQVKAVVPRKPWPKHFHKQAADDLGIPRNVFRGCMDALIKTGKI